MAAARRAQVAQAAVAAADATAALEHQAGPGAQIVPHVDHAVLSSGLMLVGVSSPPPAGVPPTPPPESFQPDYPVSAIMLDQSMQATSVTRLSDKMRQNANAVPIPAAETEVVYPVRCRGICTERTCKPIRDAQTMLFAGLAKMCTKDTLELDLFLVFEVAEKDEAFCPVEFCMLSSVLCAHGRFPATERFIIYTMQSMSTDENFIGARFAAQHEEYVHQSFDDVPSQFKKFLSRRTLNFYQVPSNVSTKVTWQDVC